MADTKVTGLTANTTPVSTDITLIVDDPGGTPLSQKITLANLMALFANPVSDDGDALGTTSLKWADLFLASGGVINFNNGNVTLTHSSGLVTMAGGGLVLSAGTTTLAPLKFQAGTNLTTAEDGALEMDATNFYGCTDAGNRGYIPINHMIRASAAINLPNDTNLNKIWDNPTNGTLTLETGVYRFEMLIAVSSMSSSGGNAQIDILGAGGATVTNWLWQNLGIDATTIANAGSITGTTPTTNASVAGVVNVIGTGTGLAFSTRGTFEVTVAGTIIPSIKLATASAAVLTVGSFFMCHRMGATGLVSVGQWT